ncbi:MAG: hypothetical protein KAJ75_03595 [Alphaproteobacteria bacterium]|nr:hypothetical protein [Alphaproteobacteria bacterium]
MRKKHAQTPKPVNLSFEFKPPDGVTATATFKQSGEIVFTDEKGKEIVPDYMERSTNYDRSKGPKIQGRHKQINSLATIGGLKELTRYDSIFVIDTNTKIVDGNQISVACFMCCRLVIEEERFRVEYEEKLNLYEFHNIEGNPELFSILKVVNDILNSTKNQTEFKIAIVTDTELGSHDNINSRMTPIYGHHYLPNGFTLLYASSDTGKEVLNCLLRSCDKEADNYFKYLKQGTIKDSEFRVFPEYNSVKYRYLFRTDWWIENPIIEDIGIVDGTKYTVYERES